MDRRLLGLVVVLLLLASASGPSRAGEHHLYVGAKKCGDCHKKELIGNQFGTWLEGPHSGAFETLRGEQAQAIAAERGLDVPAHESPDCLRCHVTAYGLPPTRMAFPVEQRFGVQCESCHGPGRDYRKKSIMSDREKAVAKGLWNAGDEVAICTTCHNEESPTHDPKRYTLPDGSHAAFDFEQAKQRIVHTIPEHVKGRYVELEKKEKEERRARERR